MAKIKNIKQHLVAGGVGVAMVAAGVLGVGTAAQADTSADPIPDNAVASESRIADSDGNNTIQPQAIKYPREGGKWSYGTTGPNGGGTVYSDYHHPSRSHGSSVVNAKGVSKRSPVTPKGKWSHASTTAIPGKVDKSYYWLV